MNLRTNVNEELSKFIDAVIEEFDAHRHFWQKLIPLKRGTYIVMMTFW